MDIKVEVNVQAPTITAMILAFTQELENFRKALEDIKKDDFLKLLKEEKGEMIRYAKDIKDDDEKQYSLNENSTNMKSEKNDNLISFDMIKSKLIELARDGQGDRVKEIIKSFGANKLSEIPKDKYQKLLEEIEKSKTEI